MDRDGRRPSHSEGLQPLLVGHVVRPYVRVGSICSNRPTARVYDSGMEPIDQAAAGNPLWQRYELSVRKLLASVDPAADVRHNHRVRGRLSEAQRQIDVWITGIVAGIHLNVAVECKRHARVVDVGMVDQFIGKLLDVGADRGVLYSYSGFSSPAVTRCERAMNPSILAVALETPQIVEALRGVPGYPADFLAQDAAPQWIKELDEFAFADFLRTGRWSKFYS